MDTFSAAGVARFTPDLFLSLELRPDFGLLTTPQTLNIIVMTQQDQAGEH